MQISKSSKKGLATPALFIWDENATKIRKQLPEGKKIQTKVTSSYKMISV